MEPSTENKPDIEIVGLKIWVHGRESEDAQDFWDGNWLLVTADCSAAGGWARVEGSILHLSELAEFVAECATLYDTLKGAAKLACMEPNLNVDLAASDSRGTLEAEIRLTPDHMAQQHSFRFSIDQSYLPGIIQGIRNVLEKFPMRGKPE